MVNALWRTYCHTNKRHTIAAFCNFRCGCFWEVLNSSEVAKRLVSFAVIFLDVMQRSPQRNFNLGGALRDIQKTAAKETTKRYGQNFSGRIRHKGVVKSWLGCFSQEIMPCESSQNAVSKSDIIMASFYALALLSFVAQSKISGFWCEPHNTRTCLKAIYVDNPSRPLDTALARGHAAWKTRRRLERKSANFC